MATPDKNHKLKKTITECPFTCLNTLQCIEHRISTFFAKKIIYIYKIYVAAPWTPLPGAAAVLVVAPPHPGYTPVAVSKYATVTVIPSCPRYSFSQFHSTRSERSSGLKRRSAVARLLGLRVRISPGAWISVSCQCLCCQVYRSRRWADPSSRGVLSSVCVCVCVSLSVIKYNNKPLPLPRVGRRSQAKK